MDKYTKKYIRLIKQTKSDQELSDIIDKIYTDGFYDGEQSTETPQVKEPDKETENHYQKELHTLIENMESDGLSCVNIISILKKGSKGYL